MTDTKPKKCAGITRAGKRCPRGPMAGSAYCLTHDPDATELRRQAGAKGGRNSSHQARALRHIPAEPLGPPELAAILSGVLVRLTVGEGAIEPKAASAAAAVAKVLLDLHDNAERAAAADLLAKLEAEAARLGIGGAA